MSTKNHFADQSSAILAVLEEGGVVRIDEAAHDMIDRGYAATFPATPATPSVTLHLRRVETHYEWKFDVKLHVEALSFDQAEAIGLDGTLRS